MKKIILGIIALIVAGILTIGVLLIDQKVDSPIGMGGVIEADVIDLTEDLSWQSLVAESIDAGEGTVITNKEIVVASTTYSLIEFTYKEKELSIQVDFVGYNNCRRGTWGTSTQEFCLQFHKNQINKNIQWAKEGIDAQATTTDYSSEVETKDLTVSDLMIIEK